MKAIDFALRSEDGALRNPWYVVEIRLDLHNARIMGADQTRHGATLNALDALIEYIIREGQK